MIRQRCSQSSVTPSNNRSITVPKNIPVRTSAYSSGLTEEILLLAQKEPSISSPIVANRGRRSTIYVAAESKAAALRRETTSPARLAYRMRSFSTSSSITNEHGIATSSSLRDIQERAASSIKHRRRTQTISIPAQTIRLDTASPRKSLSGVTISVSQTSLDEDGNPRRRAVYEDSLRSEDRASTLNALCIELEKHSPSLSCASVMAQAGDAQSLTLKHRSQVAASAVKGLSLQKQRHRKRNPLASLDLNAYRTSHHPLPVYTPMPMPPSSIHTLSDQAASFLSIDPFAATSLPVHCSSEVSPIHHPIVVDLMVMLDAAIVEWSGDF